MFRVLGGFLGNILDRKNMNMSRHVSLRKIPVRALIHLIQKAELSWATLSLAGPNFLKLNRANHAVIGSVTREI